MEERAVEPLADLDRLLAPSFAAGSPGGVVLVARGETVIFRRAYGLADVEMAVPMRAEAVFRVGSITKQFTAVAILRLVEQGRLALDDDLSVHFPADTHGRRITVEQVLTHTSGLPNFVDRDDFEALMRRELTPLEILALTRGERLRFEPGGGFYYSDTGYIMLGALVERVTGMSYGAYLERELLGPLGLRDTGLLGDFRLEPRAARGYTWRDGRSRPAAYIHPSVPHAAGGIASTVDDLLRWNQALGSGRVLRPETLARAWTSQVLPDGSAAGYGFGWDVCDLEGRPTIEHGGWIYGFGSRSMRLPEQDLTVIALVNNDADAPDATTLARRAARLVLDGSPEMPAVALSPAQRLALVGRYRTASGDVHVILDDAGTLLSRRGDRPEERLLALSATRLAFADSDGNRRLDFEFDSSGRAGSIRATLTCTPLPSHGGVREEGFT